jgi:tRNA splicing endonuclease
MSKTPFEIRADVLALAKEYMDKQLELNIELTQKLYMTSQKNAEELKAAMTPYTMEDLMEKAKEMYTFVTTKD